MILSAGWFDLGSSVGDPGLEHREDIHPCQMCSSRWFTELAILPNTHPSIQTKNEVHYIRQNNDNRLVQLHPLRQSQKIAKAKR